MRRIGSLVFFVTVLLFFIPGCQKDQTESMPVYPEVRDGVSSFKANILYSDLRINGKWTIPRFRSKLGWVRGIDPPGAGFDFFAPKRERFLAKVVLGKPGDCRIKINNRTFGINKEKTTFLVDQESIRKGWNSFWISVQKGQKIFVKGVELFPKRLVAFKKKRGYQKFFTPAQLVYYLNPGEAENIQVSFETGKIKDIDLKVLIQTEKQQKEMKYRLGKNPLILHPIDDTIHKILICFPGIKKLLTIKESVKVLKKSKKAPPLFPQPVEKFNVLFMLLDAGRPDHFGIYGYPRNTTPHIDWLSKNALVFTNCYAEAAYTLASTATLLTGLPPAYHGVLAAIWNRLDNNIITIGKLFKSRGFFTGMITANAFAGKIYNYHLGFDEFIELFDNRKLVLAEHFLKPFEDMIMRHQNHEFFIYLHLREPHPSYSMPRPFLGTFQTKYLKQTKKLSQESMAIYKSKSRSEEEIQLLTDLYDENLLFADHVVGKLLDILKKYGVFDQTIKVILSDHGEGLAEHGLIGHNIVLFKEGIRIPLIVSIPGYTSGTMFVKKPALTSDLVITLSEFYNLKYPYYHSSQGKNLLELPQNRVRISQGCPFYNQFSPFMLERYPFKSIFKTPLDYHNLRLYNLSSDPGERNPLPGNFLKQEYFFSLFKDFIRKKRNFKISVSIPVFRKKDLDNLRSLGYIN